MKSPPKSIFCAALLSCLLGILNISYVDGSEDKVGNGVVIEILKWRAKSPSVSDEDMIAAVNGMVEDLTSVKGFRHQTLYKDSDGTWVDIYYWGTEEDAHASNGIMGEKRSLAKLMSLIDPGSVSIKVMSPVQTSGRINF